MAASAPVPNARVAYVGLAAALVVGAVLLFWGLTSQSLYVDEAFVLDAARLPLSGLLQHIAAHDAHPPLFYLFARAAVSALHWPPEMYRCLTAPFGLVTIVCTWALARRAFGDVAAAAAALVVATEPTLLLFDRMFRMYAPFAALTALSCLLLVLASGADAGKRRAILWILYGLVAVIMPYLLYLGGIVVACQGAYALFDLRRRWPAIACGLVALAATIPWWWGVGEQLPQAGFTGGHGLVVSVWSARDVLGYALPVDWYRSGDFDVAFTLCVLAIVAAGILIGRGGVVGLYAGPLGIAAVATIVLQRNLVFARYLTHLIPGFALSVAAISAGVARTKWRVAGLGFVGAVIAVNAVADADQLLDKFYQSSDWNTVASVMTANEMRSDAVMLVQGYSFLVLGSMPALAGHEVLGPQQQSSLPAATSWLDRHRSQRVWYVENQFWYTDPAHEIKRHLEATRPRLREWLEPRADPSNTVFFALYGPARKVSQR